jgi:hypothetical protein
MNTLLISTCEFTNLCLKDSHFFPVPLVPNIIQCPIFLAFFNSLRCSFCLSAFLSFCLSLLSFFYLFMSVCLFLLSSFYLFMSVCLSISFAFFYLFMSVCLSLSFAFSLALYLARTFE